MKLCQTAAGSDVRTEYLSTTPRCSSTISRWQKSIYDLHDKLKSVTRGYGTMNYDLIGYFPPICAARHPGQ